jgi:hemoglobin/transferrin/lactoferrin receptor protein
MDSRRFVSTLAALGVLATLPAAAQTPDAAPAATATPAATPAPAATPLDAVTTTGTRTALISGDSALPVTVIDREQILQRDPRSPTELLRFVPGVEIDGAPRTTAMEPSIRGLGGDRIAFRLDGSRLNFNAGHRGRIFVEPELLRQVDVLRGPGSALYGSGAIGGVIAFRTIEPEDLLPPGGEHPIGGFMRGGYQSNGRTFRGTGAFAARAGDVAGLVAASGLNNGNFTDGAGNTIPFSADTTLTTLGRLNWTPGFNRFSLSALRFQDNHEIPIAANTATLQSVTDRTTEQESYVARWNYDNPNTPLLQPQVVLYRNRTHLSEQRLTGTAVRDTTELVTNGIDAQNTSRFSLFGLDRHVLTFGSELYRDEQEGRANGIPRGQFPSASQDVLGLYLQDEISIGAFSVVPGIRWDNFRQESPDGRNDQDSTRASPKISVAYRVTDWLQPYVSYAQAFRAPSLTELYVGGQHFPGNVFVPNPSLQPEISENVEIGVNLRFSDVVVPGDRLRARLTAFNNTIDNYIEQLVLARTTVSRNVGRARIQGAELELQYDSGPVFAGVTASVLKGDNLTDDEPLASVPANRVSLQGGYRFLEQGVIVGGRWLVVAEQSRNPNVPGVAQQTAGYGLLDLYATWTPPFAQWARLDVGIDNVFDQAYRRSNWNSDPPPPFYETGRNIRGSLRISV